jgi:lysophospholipase L1-like esterase
MKTLYTSSTFLAFFLSLSSIAWACPEIDGLVDINCDRQIVITCFGDSITFGRSDSPTIIGYPGRLKNTFPSAQIYNLGVPGEDTFTARSRAARRFSEIGNSDYIIILEGVNDFFVPVHSAVSTRDNLLAMVASAQNNGALTMLGNLTDILRWQQRPWVLSVNTQIDPYKQINFFSLGTEIISYDLIHPDAEGYDAMAELVVASIRAMSESNRPADTDGDGVYDFAEAWFGGNIFDPDTDDDGLLDGVEIFTYGSNPTLVDSDGDGLDDLVEVNAGANPASARPSPPVLKSLEIL